MRTYIIVLFWIHAIFLQKSDAKIDTKCYGSKLACTTHQLSCKKEKLIKITKADFGYRSECFDVFGLKSCKNKKCCKKEHGDCYVPFKVEDYQNVSIRCNGKQKCVVEGMRRYDKVDLVCNSSEVSAYSRLEYECVSPDKLSTPTTTKQTTDVRSASTKQPSAVVTPTSTNKTPTTAFTIASVSLRTTSQRINTIGPDPTPSSRASSAEISDDTGGIVGGIVGTIVVIVIVVIVIILYRRKVQQKSNSDTPMTKTNETIDPHYFTVDATLNRNVTSEYDEIHLYANTKPQYSEGYDHILAQQIKASKPKQNNNSNHIGGGAELATGDDYNILNRNKIQKVDPTLAATYQHIGDNPKNSSKNNFITDDYQHLGNNPKNSFKNNLISEDNYQHIGLPEVQLNQDGDGYNHIGNVLISRDNDNDVGTKNTNNNGEYVIARTFRPDSEYQLAYSTNGGDVNRTSEYEIATPIENQNTESDYELARKSVDPNTIDT